MLFQGQEFLEDGYFSDNDPLDWLKLYTFGGIFRLYSDTIRLRRNLYNVSAGLAGSNFNVFYVNNSDKLMAYHRYDSGGIGDDVIILINNSVSAKTNVSIGLPRSGDWHLLVNSDWKCYDSSFSDIGKQTVAAQSGGQNGLSYHGVFDFPPYSFLIYSQSNPPPPTCDFSASPTNGRNGLTVKFLNKTSGIATNFLWNFGDGTTSSEVNPTHTYYNGGNYTISLSAAGPNGISSIIFSNFISVIEGAWVDGQNITGDFENAEAAVFQNTITDWADWNSLLAMRGTLTQDKLLLGISGSVEAQSGNGFVVFIDTDSSTGENFLSPSLDSVAWRVVNMTGMVFDTDFSPDYAISVALKKGAPSSAWVDFSKLNGNSKDYWGELTDLGTSYGYLSNSFGQIALYNQNAAGSSLSATNSFSTGLEMSINLSELGGTTDMCRVQAMIINENGGWSANQSLMPINNDTNFYAVSGATKDKNYALVPGRQFMVLGVPEPSYLLFIICYLLIFYQRGVNCAALKVGTFIN